MTPQIQDKIIRLNDIAGVFSVEVNEEMNIKELGERFDPEFAADFAKMIEAVKTFKDKWHVIYREGTR